MTAAAATLESSDVRYVRPPAESHVINEDLMRRPIEIHLVGLGGTGSQLLTNLARMHLSMIAEGHPGGLTVGVYDPDRVTPSNVARQLFYKADIGRYKADVLVNRVNLAYGTVWDAHPVRYEVIAEQYAVKGISPCDVLITAVDTAKARRDIAAITAAHPPLYWLDTGNSERTGQVILSEPCGHLYALAAAQLRPESLSPVTLGKPGALGCACNRCLNDTLGYVRSLPLPQLHEVEALKEIFDPSYVDDESEPSCSLADALRSQDLFVNQQCASWASHLLRTLFRTGRLDVHGVWINLEDCRVAPVPVPKYGVGSNG